MEEVRRTELRKLPQIEKLIEMLGDLPHPFALDSARAAVDEARSTVMGGGKAPPVEEILERARVLAGAAGRLRLRRVINATGVLLHTNLGRSPLGPDQLFAVNEIGSSYSNIEYDLEAGTRGSRYVHSANPLKTLTGAEAGLVVNNNAAAVLLALAAIARGKEVLISRGELIEIGGGFRIPEILAESGAKLREVGTTNRTHLADYEHAMSSETAAIMKVHPSNYRVVGFTTSVSASDLASLAHQNGVPLIHDLGSGLLRRQISGVELPWLADEPTVLEALAEEADVVTFSADKLLGGPQAGVILGKSKLIEKMHRSPLLRAFRVDKTTLAALEATLITYLGGREAELPLWSMALLTSSEIEQRARELTARLAAASPNGVNAKIELVDGSSTSGGGSAPGREIPTVLIRISPAQEGKASPNDLMRSLIHNDPPVIARIDDDAVILDLRTVRPEEEEALAKALQTYL